MDVIKKYRDFPVQIKAAFWFLICAFLQKGISMLTTPIFTRLFTTSEYGQYSVFNSWLSIVTIFVSLNLSQGVYNQGLVKYEEERSRYSSSLQGLNVTLTLAWLIAYFFGKDFWNKIFSLTTVQMLAMLIMVWTSAVFHFWAAEQRVQFKYRTLVIITLLVSALKPGIGVLLVLYSDDKVTARILGLVLVELIGYSGLFWIQMKNGKSFFSKRFWKNALVFNIPLIPHYLSQSVLSSADRIMINNMVSDSAAGIYGLAYSISQIMLIFNTALMQTISPWMYQKIKTRKINNLSRIAYATLIIIAGVNLVLILFAPEAVSIFAPSAYYEAIWIIPPVAMSVYFMFSYDLFAKFAFYYERTNLIMTASVIGAALNVILNYIFIQMFGYRAAGYTTLLCYVIYSMFHYYFMKRICHEKCNGVMPYNTKIILIITCVFLLIGFSLLFTYYNTYVRYGLIILVILLGIWKRNKVISFLKEIMEVKKEI